MVFVAPAKISDISTWFQYYKHGKTTNLVVRPSDGALMVLDKDLRADAPVKVFDVPRAVDSLVLLQEGSKASTEVLRARAVSQMNLLTTTRNEAAAAAESTFRNREKVLLQTVESWKQAANNEGSRRQLATEIGQLQRELATLDEARRNARYPHRYIRDDMVSRMFINYDERNESQVKMWLTQHPLTTSAERSIEVGTA